MYMDDNIMNSETQNNHGVTKGSRFSAVINIIKIKREAYDDKFEFPPTLTKS